MAITSLSEVQNDYGSYRGNSLVGELGNVGTVPNDGLDNIVGKPYPFLNGIILNIGGVLYTDSGYLNALKAAGNPYISKRSLPTVPLQLSDLTTLSEDIKVYGPDLDLDGDGIITDGERAAALDGDGAVFRTQYAEAKVTKRMTTVDDVLRYLNDFLNPNTTDTVLTTSTIGSWEITTSTYSSELDVNGLYPGLEFETYEDIASPSSVTKPSTPPTETEPKKPEPIITTVVEKEKEIAIIPINTQNLNPIMFDFNSNFLLNDSVDFTRNELGQIGGLERTGLRGVYDTGELGPMAEILDELSRGGSYGSGFTFDGQDTLRIADSLEGFRY